MSKGCGLEATLLQLQLQHGIVHPEPLSTWLCKRAAPMCSRLLIARFLLPAKQQVLGKGEVKGRVEGMAGGIEGRVRLAGSRVINVSFSLARCKES